MQLEELTRTMPSGWEEQEKLVHFGQLRQRLGTPRQCGSTRRSEPSVMTIKAVIFDLDGTLVDSAPDIQVAINKLLAEEGRRPLTLEKISAMIGDGAPKLVERAMNATGEGDAPEDLSSPLGISASRMAHEPPLFSGSEA